MEWMMQGYSSADIIQQSVAKWGVNERTAKRYIAAAYELFVKATESNIKRRRGYHIEARLKLFRELTDKNTPQGALVAARIWDSIAKIEGLFVEKIDHTSGGKELKSNNIIIIENPNHQNQTDAPTV